MNTIESAINKLEASPLFYLFLSSKELFHSNFWYWLYTINQREATKLFSNSTEPIDIIFKREHNQSNGKVKAERIKSKVDLLLYFENEVVKKKKTKKEPVPVIAVENKVKDFPTSQQLKRIKDSFGENQVHIEFILATLFWKDEFKSEIASGWTVKTYRQIAESIFPDKFTNDEYHKHLIHDYKEFTIHLSDLAEQLEIKEEYDFYYPHSKYLFEKLNQINLWEGYQKLRASHFMIQFNKRNLRNDILTHYGVNNQKATLDFRPVLQLDGYVMGIQLEGNQYRKFVEGKNAAVFADNLLSANLFFDPSNTFSKGASYLNYGTSFKYQYEKINAAWPYTDLFTRIQNDIEFIKQNEHLIKNHLPK